MMLDAFYTDPGTSYVACLTGSISRDAESTLALTPSSVEVIALEILPPSRPPEVVANHLMPQLADLPLQPLALLGHGAGGAPAALAVCAQLSDAGRIAPTALFVGCSPPPAIVPERPAQVGFPISAIAVDGDEQMSPEVAFGWHAHTRRPFSLEVFPGSKCPLAANPLEIADLIAARLHEWAPPGTEARVGLAL